MTTREVRIDRGRPLTDQTETGHNRWHPDIPPILGCDPGDEVILETRDARLVVRWAGDRPVGAVARPATARSPAAWPGLSSAVLALTGLARRGRPGLAAVEPRRPLPAPGLKLLQRV